MNGFFLQSTTTPRKACKGIESALQKNKLLRESLLAPFNGRVLLGTNIAPTSLDSSVVAWAEAEWIPRDGPFAF
ncbi:unnamed protein product, partial [Prunus brigantina]